MSKVKPVIDALGRFVRTSFGAALAGGLVGAIVGLIAITAGWVESPGGDNQAPALAPTPLPQPAPRNTSAKGLTVNQIYQQDSPGVAFIQAESAPRPPSPFNPFGGSGGGTATGSGFVIDTDGHILTNAHVVQGADKIEVTFPQDQQAPVTADVVGADPSTDIAVLKVDPSSQDLHPLPLGNSRDVQVGEPVVAIGNPFALD